MKNALDEKILEKANLWIKANHKEDNKPFKKIELKVSSENAWEVGLACGGEITIYLEQIN